MTQYMLDYFSNKGDLLDSIKSLENRRGLNLLKKLNKDSDAVNFHSHLSEMRFGLFFDTFAEKVKYESKVFFDGKRYKTPDWLLEMNGQIIVTDTMQINAYSNEETAQRINIEYQKFLAERAGIRQPTISMGLRMLDPEYFFGHQSKLTDKEEGYREFIRKSKHPFIICVFPAFETLIAEFDMYLFLIDELRRGFFYSNPEFSNQVTGILLKGGFGKFGCTYFPNENALYKLNPENKHIFDQYKTTHLQR